MSSEDLTPKKNSSFDHFAGDYDTALSKGLRFTGETKEYFSENRTLILSKSLRALGHEPASILDFGCGTGSTTPHFRKHFRNASICGVDPSKQSLVIARSKHGKDPKASFIHTETFTEDETFDLAYCNGVFHHIHPQDREQSLQRIYKSLSPGGYFSFWENNPWNPMTRFIMKRVPFDHDAILVWPHRARQMLHSTGLRIISTNYEFIFPALLSPLRFLESPLSKIPLGGQYHILCTKPKD